MTKTIIMVEKKNGKIYKVMLVNESFTVETVTEVINNINNGDIYYAPNEQLVKSIDNNSYIRSHMDNKENNNLETLDYSHLSIEEKSNIFGTIFKSLVSALL
jgi:hypothetical protein